MKTVLKLLSTIIIFTTLTILTQIGGIAYLISLLISRRIKEKIRFKGIVVFIGVYGLFTFLIVPIIAPIFGREKIKHTKRISPTNYITVVLNRNYVRPQLNLLLAEAENNLRGTDVTINYLDANFPFIDKYPLLPHLSHNDGKKLDLSLIYETSNGVVADQQKSISGYGAFEGPSKTEQNQIRKCINAGYWQYDFTKYFTMGSVNDNLVFSSKGTKQLINAILEEKSLGKILIEPHLKDRLQLKDSRVRYHGCHAVRHDDHIHIQL